MERRGTSARIVRGAIVVGSFTLAAKLVGFGKELVVASVYGRGDALEAFLLALVVPTLVSGIVAGSFRQAFIPVFVRVRSREGPIAADRLATQAIGIAVAMLLGVAAVVWISAPTIVGVLARGFDPDKAERTIRLLRALAPLCALAGLPVMLAGVLEARERFRPAIVAQAAVPLAVLGAVALAPDGSSAGPLALGTIAGLAVQSGLLAFVLLRHGHRPSGGRVGAHPGLRAIAGQWLPAAGAMVFQEINTMVDQAMAAALPSGSVAALSYGYRLVSLPLSLISASLGVAILPVLADLAARGRSAEFHATAARWIRVGLWGGVGLVVVGAPLAGTLVRLVYQRGAFDAGDAAVVTAVVTGYLGMIPFFVAGIVAVQAVTARSDAKVLVAVGVMNVVVNVAGNLVLSRWFGVAGIAMSTVCVYALSAVALLAWLRRRGDVPVGPVAGR